MIWHKNTLLINIAGDDAAQLLESTCTQHVLDMEILSVRHGLFLTPKAAIISGALIYRIEQNAFVLEVPETLADEIRTHLARYRFRLKTDISSANLSVCSFSTEVALPDSLSAQDVKLFSSTPAWGHPMQSAIAPKVVEGTTRDSSEADETVVIHAKRIASLTPWLTDMQPGRMPAEVGAVDLAVSFEKGCYLGQEPVARLHWRGRPNRTLCVIEMDEALPFDSDSHPSFSLLDRHSHPLYSKSEKDVGWITTWSADPKITSEEDRFVALAVLRREVLVGDELSIGGCASDVLATARVIAR